MEKIIELISDRKKIGLVLDQFAPCLYTLSSGQVDKTMLAEKFYESAKVMTISDKNEIMGFAAFYCNDQRDKKAFLSLIAVDTKYRNRGIGKELIKQVQMHCKFEGMNRLLLEVRKENQNAVQFYSSMGFEVLSFQNTKNVYLMCKKIEDYH